MSRGITVDGISYAGTPHERFNEEDVASTAMPAQPYKRTSRKIIYSAWLILAAALAAFLSARADVTLYESMTISGSSSSDGVRVLTDFVPKSNTVVRARFSTAKPNYAGGLFCSRKDAYPNNYPHFAFYANTSAGKLQFNYGGNSFTASGTAVADHVYELEVANGIATVKDTETGTTTTLGSGLQSFTTQYRLALFQLYKRSNNDYADWASPFKGDFHYLKLYDIEDGAEVLKHHFVPCTEEENGVSVVKLFDLADGRTTYALTATGDGAAAVNGDPAPLAVEPGETVRLATDCTVGSLSGAAGAKLVADGCEVTLADGNCYLGGLELVTENGGSFVKDGAGTVYLYSPGALCASVHVAQGGAVFSANGLTQKYWRWTFTKVAQSPNPLWLGRLWLFGNDGSHVATNMVKMSDNYAPLSAGQVTWKYDNAVTNVATHADANTDIQGAGFLHRAFNDSLTKNVNNFPMLGSPVIDPANEDSWLGVEFRLRNDDNPVTGYNIMSGLRSTGNAESVNHCPVSWRVEASDDGVTWTEIETRPDVDTGKVTTGGYFYDGESYATAASRGTPVEHFKFGGYKSNGLEADAAKALSVQVDGNASLDLSAFTVATQKIEAVTIDLAAGGGTVIGGSIVAGGTLTLKNAAAANQNNMLPLLFQDASDTENFTSWTVIVDGHATSRKIKLRDGRLSFVGGLAIIVR